MLGIAALLSFIFWLKGHKLHNYERFTFYFKNANGLEAGAPLRWNGLKIGVVESIEPVTEDFSINMFPAQKLINIGRKHLNQAQDALKRGAIGDLVFARETINKAQMEIALGQRSKLQCNIRAGEHVQVNVVVMKQEVPIGPLNQVSIVPSGLIGEQYVDISTIEISEEHTAEMNNEMAEPLFVVLEPVRLDQLIRANVESSESIRDLANRVNAIFNDEDAEAIRKVMNSLAELSSDPKFKEDLKKSVQRFREFKLWNLLI